MENTKIKAIFGMIGAVASVVIGIFTFGENLSDYKNVGKDKK